MKWSSVSRVISSNWFLLAVAAALYLTGLHTPVIAFVQRGILATGLLQPTVAERGPVTDLDFRMVDHAGRTIDARDLAGKVVFLNLWASWCPPCLAELPSIEALWAAYAGDDRVVFVLLNVEADAAKGWDLVARNGYRAPVYRLAGRLPAELASGTLPTTYLVAPDGQLLVQRKGMAKYHTRAFRKLLERTTKKVSDR